MAKTLVGLYDTFAEAERVVDDLLKNGFQRHTIHLATHDGDGHRADFTYATQEPASGGHDVVTPRCFL